MNEKDIGKVFLIACTWDWTFVGRVVGFVGEHLILHQAGYFTRPGATFDVLTKEGFVDLTIFHPSKVANGEIRVPNSSENKIWPWEAVWPQKSHKNRR